MMKPERVILLIAGESGTGKSFFVANLRNALIFDTDIGGGLSYAEERIRRNRSERIEVGSYLDVIEILQKRRRDLEGITTLAIDHLTSLQQEAVIRHNPTSADDFGRSYDKATREWRKIRELVRFGDFNLVCTAHMKSKYDKKEIVGTTTDASKNIEGDMTMVLYLRRMSKYPGEAIVNKWRRDPDDSRGKVPASFEFTLGKFVAIHGFPLESPRHAIPLAAPEQVGELERLLTVVKLPDGVEDSWKAKAKVESWAEMTEPVILKCVNYLKEILSKSIVPGTGVPERAKLAGRENAGPPKAPAAAESHGKDSPPAQPAVGNGDAGNRAGNGMPPGPASEPTMMERWQEFMQQATLDNANAGLDEFAQLSKPEKKTLWPVMEAEADIRGWRFDKKGKVWVLKNPGQLPI